MSARSYSISSLPIPGCENRSLEGKFFHQETPAKVLAVIYPGLNYTCDMPLLYYTTNLLLSQECDVLQLWVDYTIPKFQSLSKLEQARWLFSDGQATWQAGQQQHSYQRYIIVGKSIGTLTMSYLLENESLPLDCPLIWFTPLMQVASVRNSILRYPGPTIYLGSSHDPTYDAEALYQVQETHQAIVIVIGGANHRLEQPQDQFGSIQNLATIMQNIDQFLRRNL